MKKHIIFGGFDYAVRWEMDQDAVYRGIDYFVDNNPEAAASLLRNWLNEEWD